MLKPIKLYICFLQKLWVFWEWNIKQKFLRSRTGNEWFSRLDFTQGAVFAAVENSRKKFQGTCLVLLESSQAGNQRELFGAWCRTIGKPSLGSPEVCQLGATAPLEDPLIASESTFGGGPGWLRIWERGSCFPDRGIQVFCSKRRKRQLTLEAGTAVLCSQIEYSAGYWGRATLRAGLGSSVTTDSFAHSLSLSHHKVQSANT